MEYDGHWYQTKDQAAFGLARSEGPSAGTQRQDMYSYVHNTQLWKSMTTGQTMPAFTAGQHTIRIGFPLSDKADDSGQRPFAVSNAIKIDIPDQQQVRRVQSMAKLHQLGLVYNVYMEDHEHHPPQQMEDIYSYIESDETYQWLVEHVILLDAHKMPEGTEAASIPVAYDTSLLNTQRGTIALFADGHLEFVHNDKIQDVIKNEDFAKSQSGRVIYYPRNTADFSKKELPDNEERMRMALEKLLASKVDISSLTGETPFEKAVDILRNSTRPALTIIVLWSDLSENAAIKKDTPVKIESEQLQDITLKGALDVLLETASHAGNAELGFATENGIITIATKDSLPSDFANQVYNVTDLVVSPTIHPKGSIEATSQLERQRKRIQELKQTIVESIAPGSWFVNGGEGRIEPFGDTQLITWQSPEGHAAIQAFLDQLARNMMQVEIETRFSLVDNNFMEDVGIDTVDADYRISDGTGELVVGSANSEEILEALEPKPLPETMPSQKFLTLDDTQSSFLVRATQAHRNAKTITAPKVLVLNREIANLSVNRQLCYIDIDDEGKFIHEGISLELLGEVQADKKTVLLKGQMKYVDVLENRPLKYNDQSYDIPYLQVANIPVYTTIENGGIVLIVGPEMTVSKEFEGDSKIPYLSRGGFSNRPKTTDNKLRMLIMIKTTIVEHDAVEAEAIVGVLAPRAGGD